MDDRDSPFHGAADDAPEGYGTIEGGTVLVPEGEYVLRYCWYETSWGIDDPKVIVHFAIVENEDYEGSPVERYYNVKRLIGEPRRYGDFVAKARGDLFREQIALHGTEKRLDRISFADLRDKRIMARIETVRTDRNRRKLDAANHYSRVSRLLKILHDDSW